MKKSFAVVVLVCASVVLFAQKADSKFSLSFFASPTVTSRTISAETHYPDFLVKTWKEIETPKLGYSFGALAGYRIHKNITLQSGLSFSNNGYREKERLYITEEGDPDFSVKTVYHQYYLDIPLQAKYTFFRKGKFSAYAIAGVEANFNIANSLTNIYPDGEKERSTEALYPVSEFRKYNFSVVGAVGVEYAVGKRISLFAQVTYRQMVLPMETDFAVKRRLNSTGLTLGAKIQF